MSSKSFSVTFSAYRSGRMIRNASVCTTDIVPKFLRFSSVSLIWYRFPFVTYSKICNHVSSSVL
jgi:hypothetical protein